MKSIIDRHFLQGRFSICLEDGLKDSARERVSSHENCVVAVFEFERITGVAELNEGCRRARLLRDRCCHGDTNPVLRQFTISPVRYSDPSDLRGRRDPYLLTRSHVSMAILCWDKKGTDLQPFAKSSSVFSQTDSSSLFREKNSGQSLSRFVILFKRGQMDRLSSILIEQRKKKLVEATVSFTSNVEILMGELRR